MLIWKFSLEFFENLVKRDFFFFRIWIIGNLVYVKTCYSFKSVKSLSMTKNPNSMTMNPRNHSQLMAWGHFDQENKITHCPITSLWAITFLLIDMIWTILDQRKTLSTCAYLESGTLTRDTLWNSIGWPKWVNEKMKKEKWKKKRMIVTSCIEIFN